MPAIKTHRIYVRDENDIVRNYDTSSLAFNAGGVVYLSLSFDKRVFVPYWRITLIEYL